MVCFRGLRPAGKPAAFCVDISPPGRYNKNSGIKFRENDENKGLREIMAKDQRNVEAITRMEVDFAK